MSKLDRKFCTNILLNSNKYNGMFSTLNKIYIEEGIRGLYRGMVPALCTVPMFWGFYWTSYENMKIFMYKQFPSSPSYIHHTGAAITAGAIGDVLTNRKRPFVLRPILVDGHAAVQLYALMEGRGN